MSTLTMTSTTTKKSYTLQSEKSNSKVVEDSKKKSSLLKDNSWIKKSVHEDKPVDQNSNFGRSVLSRFRSNENLIEFSEDSTPATVTSPTSSLKKTSSVQTLSKRFSASQDQLDSKSPTATNAPNDSKIAVTTTRTSDVKSPTKSEIFTAKVISDEKPTTTGKTQTQLSKNTEVTTKRASFPKPDAITVSATKNTTAQDNSPTVKSLTVTNFKDTPIKDDIKTIKSVTSPTSTVKTISSSSTYTSQSPDSKKTSYSVSSKNGPDDQLVDTLKPKSIKNIQSTTDTSSEKSSKTSSSTFTKTSNKESIVEDYPSSTVVTRTIKTVSSEPESKDFRSSTKTYTTTTESRDDIKTIKSVTSPTSTVKTISSSATYTSQSPDFKKTSYSVSSKNGPEDQLVDTLKPKSIKTIQSTLDTSSEKSSKTSSSTFTKTSYKESIGEDYPSSTVVTRTIRTVSSEPESKDFRSSTKTYTTTTDSRSENLIDTYSSRNVQTAYSSADRKITDRDLCTYCNKPMLSETKMIIEEMDIKCHASCFKCDVCQSSLGHLKAGDTMWLYRQNVHCETCFGVTKSKWHR